MKETWPRRTDSNHEHASRPLAAVLLHMLQWILLPFVISGVLAYICRPAIDCLTARTRLPRPLVAISTFIILLVIASLIGLLGVPSVVRELIRLGTDFQGTAEALARGLIGSATVTLPGQPMTAEQVTQAVAAGACAGFAAEHGLSFAVVRA